MLQKEVAARLSASPRYQDYGILTLSCNHIVASNICAPFRRPFFFREPEVDSAFVRLIRARLTNCRITIGDLFSTWSGVAFRSAENSSENYFKRGGRLAARPQETWRVDPRRGRKNCRSPNGSP